MPNQQEQALIVCPTKRLARSLQLAHDKAQQARGLKQWQPLNIHTLDQWLTQTLDDAYLIGELPTSFRRLTQLEERLIWQSVIAKDLKADPLGDLFDLSGLADNCIEANQYMVAWQLGAKIEQAPLTEETRRFLGWQQAFTKRCEAFNGLESVRYFDWQIQCLARGAGQLPSEIVFKGFDQTAPQEQKLRDVLQTRGCSVSAVALGLDQIGDAQHVSLLDEATEMRAMVAWAKREYEANPQVKLAMVVPQLTTLRNPIADLIDDVFQPSAVRPSLVESPRVYNFSLGLPLTQQPVIQAALNLLRQLFSHQLSQTDISELLLSSYWSASETEADARALLDAKMREYLPQSLYWARLLKFIEGQSEKLALPKLSTQLAAACAFVADNNKRQVPSKWAAVFRELLSILAWSGERIDSSHEYQAKEAWQKALQAFEQLDFLGDQLSASKAVSLLNQLCQEQVFQVETTGEPPLQVLGIMEALSEPVDALWVMGMNDVHWPLPARPNPLLPATIQRDARVTNADSSVQSVFAATIHQRLLHSAKQVIFSSSEMAGEKELRASPLMADIPLANDAFLPMQTLAEAMASHHAVQMEAIEDDIAPAVQEGDHVRGGTGLIKAQAICPAWAFYQYRLGAKALRIPKNGFDAAERGQLVHGALEAFYQQGDIYRHFADLQQMSDADLESAIDVATSNSIEAFKADYQQAVSEQILLLEHERICELLMEWLQYEKTRDVKFKIADCEVEQQVLINDIEVTLKIDRVHVLENGELELVDYKTGQTPAMTSWAETRITEPQLPIYAVFYAADGQAVSGVQFGMVKTKDHAYKGVSTINFEAEVEKRKPNLIRAFDDWQSLKSHWQTAIEDIVQTIKDGDAAVVYADEKDMLYCEVKPLLRLPERQLQFERQLSQPVEEGAHD